MVKTATILTQSMGEQTLLNRYQSVRAVTEQLCSPLEIDDFNIQTMPDVSPIKWHIAHVSWFFETFILQEYDKHYRPFHPQFQHLFNSYYELIGSFHPRPQRGFLNRPTLQQIFDYRHYVDVAMAELLLTENHPDYTEIALRAEVGINHEQQHQELMLTDILHVFACNPMHPQYQSSLPEKMPLRTIKWQEYDGGLFEIGHAGKGFAYDNETPRHKTYIEPFRLADRLVSNGEYINFIADGAYLQAKYWLSDGWKTVRQQQWQAPLYWQLEAGQWWQMTLNGMQLIDEAAPVSHISLYEADAYARWANKRLPTEAEWEVAAKGQVIEGNLRDSGYLQTMAAVDGHNQLYGDVWEWTQSAYSPYPGYRPLPGALGEYNGKFMASQFVLRGGSCFTPADHIRSSYRNFFYPGDRWQCTGMRLAEDGQ